MKGVDKLKEYKIPYVGLKLGLHTFNFNLERAFFTCFEYGEIEDAAIKAIVSLDKKTNMMILDFQLSGTVETVCDICNDPLTVDIESKPKLIVKFGEETTILDDEVLILGPAEFELDLAQYLYEYAHLALPSKRTHPHIEDCNQSAIAYLDGVADEDDEEDDDDTDPRWDALKNI